MKIWYALIILTLYMMCFHFYTPQITFTIDVDLQIPTKILMSAEIRVLGALL